MKRALGLDLAPRMSMIEGRMQGIEDSFSVMADAIDALTADKR